MADFHRQNSRGLMKPMLLGVSLLALAACNNGNIDLDFRGAVGGLDTSDAARLATQDRPTPDDRGVISYPNFQVAVARRGDTLRDVASRVGLPATELARYNGITEDTGLRAGEVIALPKRVAEPSPDTGALTIGPILPQNEQIDITTLAGNALDRAESERPRSTSPFQSKPAPVQSGNEPIQHQVKRGETAYSISRLYNVSVRSLADWNGLGPNLTVREGQFLLIPVASDTARRRAVASAEPDVTIPGEGSPTPNPPSASLPLPEATAKPAPAADPLPSPNLAEDRTVASGTAKMLLPVTGKIIRGYEKDKTDGIDIAAQAGAGVRAAADGVVAAITRNTDQVPILVIRHPNNLLTVYANIDSIKVNKDDKITRGQSIATVRGTGNSFLHFEVRQGIDSVDPVPFLN